MTAAAWAVLAAYAIPVLVIAVCVLAGRRLGRRRRDRTGRPLSRRERAQWRHITRAYAAGAELDELRARIDRFEQDGSEDAR